MPEDEKQAEYNRKRGAFPGLYRVLRFLQYGISYKIT